MKGENHMKSYLIGFFALVSFIFSGSQTTEAGADWVAYKPGIVQAAIANGETTLLFYRSTWWGTCARQGRVLKKLRASYPEYNKTITFVLIDWDTYKNTEVTTSRRIPRRSTMVLIKGGKEIARLVAKSDEGEIKALLMKAFAQWKFSRWSKSEEFLSRALFGEKVEVFEQS